MADKKDRSRVPFKNDTPPQSTRVISGILAIFQSLIKSLTNPSRGIRINDFISRFDEDEYLYIADWVRIKKINRRERRKWRG